MPPGEDDEILSIVYDDAFELLPFTSFAPRTKTCGFGVLNFNKAELSGRRRPRGRK